MSAAVIGWQIFIFVTIFISEGKRGWVAAFWVVWTLAQVYALPLSVIQFLTIYLGYKLAGPAEAKNDRPAAPEVEQANQPKALVAPAISNRVEKTHDSEGAGKKQSSFGHLLKTLSSEELSDLAKEFSKKMDAAAKDDTQKSVVDISPPSAHSEPQIDSAYVTKHNFRKISWFYLQPNGDISIDKIFSVIYDKDLSAILNQKEATQIYVQKQMMANELQAIHIAKKQFSRDFAFSVTPPKYHKDKNCVFIKADFSNYLVPPAIKAMGDDKVREFQEYCETHKKEFAGKPDDVFWVHVGLRFNVQITPERVNYDNSGIENVEKLNVDDLRERINETISNLLGLLESEPRKDAVLNLRYAPNLKAALSNIQDENSKKDVTEFFQLKSDLASFLFELYKRRSGHNSYILPVTLLKACGLEPCKGCCG